MTSENNVSVPFNTFFTQQQQPQAPQPPQQPQAPQPPQQPQAPQPPQQLPQQPQMSQGGFNVEGLTVDNANMVNADLLARQASMIEDYQNAEKDRNAYNSIIAQQQAQIDALIAQNSSLTQQVTQMIQNGAQFQQAQPQVLPNQMRFNQQALSDDKDYSLEGLAEQIGKRNR